MPSEYMQALYYRDRDGAQPVKGYLGGFSPEERAILLGQVDMLNRLKLTDPPLPYPLSSQVDGPLRELRCHLGRYHHRIFYQRSENFFILLHIIQKNTRTLPKGDINEAKARWDDFKVRMNADPRMPPRPAGDDAPPPSFRKGRNELGH